MPEDFAPMSVAQILDKTTVVISGPGVERLKLGEELNIVAVGREIPHVGAPLVVPKATIEVTSALVFYAIARTTTYEEEVAGSSWVFTGDKPSRTITKHYVLKVDEKDLTGNPASAPVEVGDPVIRREDLPRFVSFLSAQKK